MQKAQHLVIPDVRIQQECTQKAQTHLRSGGTNYDGIFNGLGSGTCNNIYLHIPLPISLLNNCSIVIKINTKKLLKVPPEYAITSRRQM